MNGNAAICDQLGDHPIYETVKHLGQGEIYVIKYAPNGLSFRSFAQRFKIKHLSQERLDLSCTHGIN